MATAVNWGAAFLVSATFLSIVDVIGTEGAFFLFALMSMLAFWWINRYVPETKGKTLEEVEEVFSERTARRHASERPRLGYPEPQGASLVGYPGRQ